MVEAIIRASSSCPQPSPVSWSGERFKNDRFWTGSKSEHATLCFLWNISNWRQVLIRCTEPRQEKSNQLFLLLDRQNIGGLLDLKE
jgi:hypothetical protein